MLADHEHHGASAPWVAKLDLIAFQVTDAYLASLAGSHHATLATFDVALASAIPGDVDLIP